MRRASDRNPGAKTNCRKFWQTIFAINHELLLRVSETPMTLEQEKFRRVATLHSVPKMLYTGMLKREAGPVYYTLLTLLPWAMILSMSYPETTQAQQKQLGEAIAGISDKLQELKGAGL